MGLSVILAILTAAFWLGPAQATATNTAQASHGGLSLTLVTHVSGSSVTARAKLTNGGTDALNYYGGCAPPVLQIQARDQTGRHVYGWRQPQVSCGALSLRELAPGASITRRAHFTIRDVVTVRAVVQVKVIPSHLFRTPPLKVSPAP